MDVPKLKDDCFALPPGIDWTPVDTALGMLRERLSAVVGQETVPVAMADGRILATTIDAKTRQSTNRQFRS